MNFHAGEEIVPALHKGAAEEAVIGSSENISRSVIKIFAPAVYAASVAEEISSTIVEAMQERGACSCVLAGGETPRAIYRCLARPAAAGLIRWPNVRLYLTDERWVPYGSDRSNYRMVCETLVDNILGAKPMVVPVDTSMDSAERGAREYDDAIRGFVGIRPGKLPLFDLVLLGIGEDGHIASIFPGGDLWKTPCNITHAVEHPQYGTRVTLGPEALFHARKIFFMVQGSHKAAVVKRVLWGSDAAEEVPARLFAAAAERTIFFIDSDAAAGLKMTLGSLAAPKIIS